ncbi:MAG: helix-turn-helix domain-containing protein [Lachnospiraceae bacterium]
MKFEIEIFAENLSFARRARGYSQAYMADCLGIARSTYAGYETGKRSPDIKMFAEISKTLFVSADELLGRYDYGTPNLIREAKAEYFVEPEYSVEDYFALPDCVDYELIEGQLIKKNAPGYSHQIIVGQIFMNFYQHTK